MTPIRYAAALALAAALPITAAAQSTGLDSAVQLYHRQEYGKAMQLLRAAPDTRDAQLYYWLGRVALGQNDADAAVRWLEKAVSTNDGSSEYHLWLGRAVGTKAEHASVLKQPALATRTKVEFERALARDSLNLEARVDLISYLAQAPGVLGGSEDRARAMASELRALDPYRGALSQGEIEEDKKHPGRAETEYRALMTSYPDSAEPAVRLASLYQHDQRWDEAFALVDSFVVRRPDDPAAQYQLGEIAALSGQRLADGEAALERYLSTPVSEELPPYADAHVRLGMIRERAGNTAGARTEYEAALAIDPRQKDARKALDRLR